MASDPQPIYRKDYAPPSHLIDAVQLRIELHDGGSEVHGTLELRRNPDGSGEPLRLHGENMELISVSVDGTPLHPDAFEVTDSALEIRSLPDRCELQTVVRIDPDNNTALEGLYRTGTGYVTQCEAEGFRRITYFLDRPDVMARYRTTIVADAERYPVLLSNGNRVDAGDAGDGRHYVTWEDPFPKPSYLFAMVAGDLRAHRGTHVTPSGREVSLEIWVEPENTGSCEHALRSLQKAMKWDEETFGLEYDLDVYMVVAVSDFNMAAMENKGLNIFNAKFVLARPETATDDDYENIEGVIGHEYFHNWTGNRVTCQDWFQLTLKEGLTVFRDEQFTAAMTSAAVKRIQDVRLLRTAQFAEDMSPTAHPIRPESYIEMNNFYTVTVYNKGAEVVRMYETLLNPTGFRRGMDLYFERHDGQAVTCDDFRAAMADAGERDLDQFGRWYAQKGTPVVQVSGQFDAAKRSYTLRLRQRPPAVADADAFEPLLIPIRMGLLTSDGAELPLRLAGEASPGPTTRVIELCTIEHSVTFEDLDAAPIPSLLRGFSAPVRLEVERAPGELATLMAHDPDPFSRWDAVQSVAQTVILDLVERRRRNEPLVLDPAFAEGFGHILVDERLDGSLRALTMTLPDERFLGQQMGTWDVDGVHEARQFVRRALAQRYRDPLMRLYDSARPRAAYQNSKVQIDGRRAANAALAYLSATGDAAVVDLIAKQFRDADSMTDTQAALGLLCDLDAPQREQALTAFYERWRKDPLVLDKWFSVQAMSSRADTLAQVRALCTHADFSVRNPNRARSLLGVFSVRNPVRFHDSGGEGYGLLADKILEIDGLNPQLAARLLGVFNQWRRFDTQRQAHMRGQLERIERHTGVSKDVYEIATKCLASP